MKPYKELSFSGRLRRLHTLAESSLESYDLKDPQIIYHAFETNLLYRVTTAAGERFMLRLASPGWRSFEDLLSEALWLEALARDTDIHAPRVITSRTGKLVLPLSRPDIPKTWNASLMSWVPGRLLGRYLTRRNLEKMGALFAALHVHGTAWTPPEGFTTRRFEHWLGRGEPNLITGLEDRPLVEAVAALNGDQRKLLERMHRNVEAAYIALDRADLRVIHCDLWHDNIKLHRGELQPFDFEDTVWGFRAHDIAMAMLDLLEDTDEARYAVLLAAFRRGYTAHLAWPEAPIEPFQVGRLLWKINWVARFQAQSLGAMVERHTSVFVEYARRGVLIRPPQG